jgi:DUF1016 N-terminal domain
MNNPSDYSQLLGDIKQRIQSAQYEALKAVNKELIGLYWDIGRIICDRPQTAGWGKSVVEQLAQDIQAEFPGISGFSARNVWNMWSFTAPIAKMKNCNHWLQKLAGLITSSSWKSVKMTWSANFISA